MINKVRSLGSEDTPSHLQASHDAGRHQDLYEKTWRKMGLPLSTEKIASKIWTTTTWAVYDGDVTIMLALRSILGWRTTAWWRSRASWSMARDPCNVQMWKHKVGSIAEEYSGTHRWRDGLARGTIG